MNRRFAFWCFVAAFCFLLLAMFWRQTVSDSFVKFAHPKIKIFPRVSMADVRFAEHYVKEAQLIDSTIRAIRVADNNGVKEMEVFVGTMQVLKFNYYDKIGWRFTSDAILTP